MIYQDFKKIVESGHLNFLIGSGASRPFLGTLKNIEQLLTDLSNDEEIEPDQRIIIETSIKYHYFKKCIEGNLFLDEELGESFKETKNSYHELVQSLNEILIRRRSNLVSKQVNLFTSNLDIFLEWTLENNQYSYNDGFFGRMNPVFGTENFHNTITKTSTHYEYQSEVPLFNIFKLHGNVNWKLDEEQVIYDHGLSILESISNIELENQYILEIEYEEEGETKINDLGALKEQLQKSEIEKKDIHDHFLDTYSDLVMINPTKQKFETTTRDLTFYELLRMYSNHLERENSILFVVGFSFQDEHIREITRRVASSNPTLTIVIFAFDKQAKESIESLLNPKSNLSNIKFVWDNSDEDPTKYSLDVINERYFSQLASDLSSHKDEKEIAVEQDGENG